MYAIRLYRGQNKRGDGAETTACPLRKQSDTIASPDTCAGESDAGRTDSSQIRHHSTLWGKMSFKHNSD